jgi:hypothetical protein
MPKFTRHIKKHIKNVSLKNRVSNAFDFDKKGGYHEREGIIDVAENTASKALTTVGDIGLRVLGLERINNTDNKKQYVQNDEKENITSNIATTKREYNKAFGILFRIFVFMILCCF